ncbi:MAG: hypothetical protein IJF54_02230 [Clostridia bacterium]|nr:hypothetical protein [Clostridia bacterium]
MGFLDAMKGANNSWGVVTADFIEGQGYIGPEKMVNNASHTLMLSGTGLKESVLFTKDDVSEIKVLFATSEWIKFRISLKNGKTFVATFLTLEVANNGKKVANGLLNFEWWLADIIYK